MEAQIQSQQAQAQQAKNISEQIKQERERQQNTLNESQRLRQISRTSNEPSLVSVVGDAASSLASAMGSAIGSVTSTLLLNPIKGTARFIKDSLTPSVKSSDGFPQPSSLTSFHVFPQSTSLSSSDIFPKRQFSSALSPLAQTYSPPLAPPWPNQTVTSSQNPSNHPSFNPPSSPFPIIPNTSTSMQTKTFEPISFDQSLIQRAMDSSSQIPTVTLDALNLMSPSSASASASAQSRGMRSSSIQPSASASAQSQGMRFSSLDQYDIIPQEEVQQYVAPIPEYNQPLPASYYQQPPAFVDDQFPTLEE